MLAAQPFFVLSTAYLMEDPFGVESTRSLSLDCLQAFFRNVKKLRVKTTRVSVAASAGPEAVILEKESKEYIELHLYLSIGTEKA